MKTIFGIGLLLLVAHANAQADFSGKYVKQNGEVVVRQKGQNAEFSISSVTGIGGFPTTCGLEGSLLMIDAERGTYTSPDKTDLCSATLKFAGEDLEVSTKNCASACAQRAIGSMDGVYRKKKSSK